MPPCPDSVVSARAEVEDTLVSSVGSPYELAKNVCQIMISDHQDEVHGELKFICKDMNEFRANPTKVIDHTSVYKVSFQNTMTSRVVADEVA